VFLEWISYSSLTNVSFLLHKLYIFGGTRFHLWVWWVWWMDSIEYVIHLALGILQNWIIQCKFQHLQMFICQEENNICEKKPCFKSLFFSWQQMNPLFNELWQCITLSIIIRLFSHIASHDILTPIFHFYYIPVKLISK